MFESWILNLAWSHMPDKPAFLANQLKPWYHDPAICMCRLHLFYNICLPISTPLWMGWDPANWRWDNRLLPLSLSAQWGWSNHNQISQHPLHALTFSWDDHTGRYVVEMVKITAETDTNHIICKSMNPGVKWNVITLTSVKLRARLPSLFVCNPCYWWFH